VNRTDLTFLSRGEYCAAWLYMPDGDPAGPLPCVVMAHGFGAVREARLGAYASRFARAGYAVLVFDYRHFGDSGGEPRQLLDIARQQDDWRAAIAFARSLSEVDPELVVAWGTSFGGGHVAVMAAEDDRLAAAISQNPFVDGIATLRALGPVSIARLTLAGVRDQVAHLRRRPAHRLPIVGPPGTTGAMTTPDAEPGYRAMYDGAEESFVNWVAARIALRVGLYRPGRRAAEIACPWLVQVCDDDAITPAKPALAAAAQAPWSQAERYPGGHFDVNVAEGFERAVADQVAFLEQVLPGSEDTERKAEDAAPA
jgi:dienelactone hydrolase